MSYNPHDHTVPEVLAYLGDADEVERRRVLAAETVGQARKGILGEVEMLEDCGRPDFTGTGICRQHLLHPDEWVCRRCAHDPGLDGPRDPVAAVIAANRENLAEAVEEVLTDEQRVELDRRRSRRRKDLDGSPSTTEPAEPVNTEAATADEES